MRIHLVKLYLQESAEMLITRISHQLRPSSLFVSGFEITLNRQYSVAMGNE